MADDQTGAQNASDTTNDAQGTNDTTNDAQTPQGDAGTPNDASTNDAQGNVVTRDEYEKALERMRAADRAKSEAENKLKERERKDMGELEKAQADVKDLTAERDALRTQLNDVRLENAFLSNNKHSWVDPQDALRLLDMDGVEIKDDKVHGLAEAVDKLAKAKPHLLKKDEGGNSSSAASGTANNGTRKGGTKTPPKNYQSRFPALRR
jgi:hypothetical protein